MSKPEPFYGDPYRPTFTTHPKQLEISPDGGEQAPSPSPSGDAAPFSQPTMAFRSWPFLAGPRRETHAAPATCSL
jgi:hypothetical protein